MTATTFLKTALLNHAFNDPAYTQPTTFYVGLLTGTRSNDDDTTGLTEVSTSGTAYARVSFTAADIGAAAGTDPVAKTVTALLTFAEATASWGTPGFYAVYDASSAGNALWVQALTNPQLISIGNTPRIPANTLVFQAGDISSPVG